MRGSRNFCQFYLILSLFYSLQRGSNGFIAEKNILILYQGSRGAPSFSRGCPTFSRGEGGPNANFYIKPIYKLVIFQWGGGGVWTPIPFWIRTWAMSS